MPIDPVKNKTSSMDNNGLITKKYSKIYWWWVVF